MYNFFDKRMTPAPFENVLKTHPFWQTQFRCEEVRIAQEEKGGEGGREGGQWRLEQQPDEANCQNHVAPSSSDARITASMLSTECTAASSA